MSRASMESPFLLISQSQILKAPIPPHPGAPHQPRLVLLLVHAVAAEIAILHLLVRKTLARRAAFPSIISGGFDVLVRRRSQLGRPPPRDV